MSRIGTLMICAATLALGLGCDDGRGGEDGGGIVLMDSGPDTTPDTGTPPPPTDSGPAPSGCSVAGAMGFPALPAGCLPRCSSATFRPPGFRGRQRSSAGEARGELPDHAAEGRGRELRELPA
ncbi:MAG: hypothetical protein EVA89_39525, partial [Sandaracinaceae bacterium]